MNSARAAGETSHTAARRTSTRTRRSRAQATGPQDPRSRMLAAFPWAGRLSTADQDRFANELAHHPSEMSNAQLEALIQGWKASALGRRTA